MHDNVFEYFDESLAGNEDHGNTMEYNAESSGEPTGANYFYNNVIRHIGQVSRIGVNLWFNHDAPMVDYLYNNVVYDVTSSGNFWDTSGTGEYHFFNNTIQLDSRPSGGGGSTQSMPGGPTIFATNEHDIDADPSASGPPYNPAVPANQVATELDQTIAAAANGGNGYTMANGYAPTAAYHPTAGAGTNLSSHCGNDPDLAPLCKSTTFGVAYDGAGHRAVCSGMTAKDRPTQGAWDVGAYTYP
jgi:hypothetical protein